MLINMINLPFTIPIDNTVTTPDYAFINHTTFTSNTIRIPRSCAGCLCVYYQGEHPDNGCEIGILEDVHDT